MKYRTTKRDVMNGYRNIIRVGYDDLQTLLICKNPVAYTSGAAGWNADIYEIDDNTAIVTGYNAFGNVKPKWETINSYEKRAQGIKWLDEQRKEKKLTALLDEFIKEVLHR